MSIDTQELRAIVERMTPGEWRVLRDQCHFDTASDIVCGWTTIAQTCSNYPQLEHDAAGIVALRNLTPALLDEVERLREALKFYAGWGVLNPQYDDQVQNDGSDKARAALGDA